MNAAVGSKTGKSSFDPRMIAGLIMAGIVGFIGFWVLSAFAPELDSGRDGGPHALSRSAVGYAALAEVLRATGRGGAAIRDLEQGVPRNAAGKSGLLVLTPPPGTHFTDIQSRLAQVDGRVLIILPKYLTFSAGGNRDRVMSGGYLNNSAAMLGPAGRAGTQLMTPPRDTKLAELRGNHALRLFLPDRMMALNDSASLEPVITVDGETLLARMDGRQDIYVLADPDFLNNLAFRDDQHAQAAVALITTLAGSDAPVAFDVTLNGYGANARSLLRMAFVPPFLGFTLCLIVGGLLALWQGFIRFGPPILAGATRVAGKKGLVETSARLIVQAGRALHFRMRYSGLVREVAARRLHAPTGLVGPALDAWLDRFPDSQGRLFTPLAARVEAARTDSDMVEQASALAQWRRDVLRDN